MWLRNLFNLQLLKAYIDFVNFEIKLLFDSIYFFIQIFSCLFTHQRQQSAPRNFVSHPDVRFLFFRSWRSPLVCERSARVSLEQRLTRAPLQQSLQLQQCCERSIHVLLEQRRTPAQLQKCSGAQLQQCFGERRLQGSPSRSSRPT